MTVKNYKRNALMVSVHDAMGGNGRLFFAATLAAILVQGSQRAVKNYLSVDKIDVCFVEIASQGSNCISIAGAAHPHAGELSDSGVKINAKSVQKYLIYNEVNGYHTLLAPVRDGISLPPKFYREVLSVLRKMFDVVIVGVESSEIDSPLRDVAMEAAHLSLLVTSVDREQLERAGKWVDEVTSLPGKKRARKFSRDDIRVIVNRADMYDRSFIPIEPEQLTVDQVCDVVEEYLPGVAIMDVIPLYAYDGIIEVHGAGAEFTFHTDKMMYSIFHKLGNRFATMIYRELAPPVGMDEFLTL